LVPFKFLGVFLLRISRMADYAVIATSYMAKHPEANLSASDIAEATGVPLPSISKILKKLAKAEILQSKRGVAGGYKLSRSPKSITIADLISSVEGPIVMADCLDHNRGCSLESFCTVKIPWQRVSNIIEEALTELSLADIVELMDLSNPFLSSYPIQESRV